EANEPQQAFPLNVELADVRDASGRRPVGVDRCTWGPTYALPLRKPEPAVARKDKVVDPTVAMSGNGVYKTLTQALDDAEPDDVILIKKTGELKVAPVRLEKPTLDVTIKPHPDSRPVLTLGDTAEKDVALFTVHDGKLALEGLEFRLQPG